MVKVKEIVARFEEFAPQQIAEKNDPIGLQLGSLEHEVKKMMVTLDVRPEVVEEAIEAGVDFIFAHHPAMFVPVKHFDLADPQNQMYAMLIKHDITVYAAHTNLDNANGGMNDWLAEALNIEETKPLLPPKAEVWYKLAVFVPEEHATVLRQALAKAGAGHLGEYTACSYSVSGTGRFRPKEGATPYLGEVGQVSEVAEEKVEVVFPAKIKAKVLQAMQAAHPYEEIAFDLYQVEGLGQGTGMGRVGKLSTPMTVNEYVAFCKQVLGLQGLRLVAKDPTKTVERVAVLGGSGAKFYPFALKAQADVYVTGDVSYHTAHDMYESGLAVIDPGHHFEAICKPHLKQLFTHWNEQNAWQIEVISSKLNTDPFTFI